MSTTLRSILRVEVAGVGTLSATHTVTTEAYDRITAPVPAADGGAGTVTVDVQPGGAGQVRFVHITADAYPLDGSGAAEVTYEVDGGNAIALDAPLLLVGGAIEELLGNVQQVVLTNESGEEVNVTIVVGRNATA